MMSSSRGDTIFGDGSGKVRGMTSESELKTGANGGSLARPHCCSSVTAPPGDAPSSRRAGRAKSLAAPASLIVDTASWLGGDNTKRRLWRLFALIGGCWQCKWLISRICGELFNSKDSGTATCHPSRVCGDESRRAPEYVTANSPEYATLEGLFHRDSPQYVTKKIMCDRMNRMGSGLTTRLRQGFGGQGAIRGGLRHGWNRAEKGLESGLDRGVRNGYFMGHDIECSASCAGGSRCSRRCRLGLSKLNLISTKNPRLATVVGFWLKKTRGWPATTLEKHE